MMVLPPFQDCRHYNKGLFDLQFRHSQARIMSDKLCFVACINISPKVTDRDKGLHFLAFISTRSCKTVSPDRLA